MPDLILKADSYDKQSSKWRKARPADGLYVSHMLQPKYDGCHAIIITGAPSTGAVFTREGKKVRSMDKQAEELTRVLGPGLVVQGESWIPGKDFPYISGTFRRFEQSEELLFIAYNCLTIEEWAAQKSNRPYRERFAQLYPLAHGHKYVHLASHYNAGTWKDHEQIAQAFKDQPGPFDGVILWDEEGTWEPGRSRNGEIIKVKPDVSLDLRCTAVSTFKGEKTGRNVYTLTVELPNGQTTEVGSGVPHILDPADYLGKIVEVEAMGWTPDGKLREPRFKGLRPDKTEPDQ